MKNLAFILAFCLVSSYNVLQAQTINEDKSEVKFHITGGGIFKVKGTFTGMKGDFNLNTNDLEHSGFSICIGAATINTKNKKRDAHLKDPDFFEVEKYPTICFESSSVSKTSSGYQTTGQLTIHGVTKEVTIPFTYTNNTFTGELVVNRFDYELGKDFGTMRVGTEATITIICVVH
ncbi:YceI family protein [Lacinutrix iliipiscaria]|uniref:YceI family protein n=1 Tax=Lacinutrix iliipiscaria TaxID=1230532 RepID=A0ABW5WTB9_9FLAO